MTFLINPSNISVEFSTLGFLQYHIFNEKLFCRSIYFAVSFLLLVDMVIVCHKILAASEMIAVLNIDVVDKHVISIFSSIIYLRMSRISISELAWYPNSARYSLAYIQVYVVC